MAEFQFKCPQCGQVIEADESFCGQEAPCPFCEKNIVIPSAKPPVITSRPKPKQTIRWKRGQQTTSQEDAVGNPVELQPDTTTSQKAKTGFWGRVRKCASPRGRASRKEFWIINGIQSLYVFFVLFLVLLEKLGVGSSVYLLLIPIGLTVLTFSWCLWTRRLHDINRSDYWLLPLIVGEIACKVLGFSLFSVLMDLTWFAWFIVLGSIDGTPGENDYGSDPKGRGGSGERTNTSKIAIWILTAISTVVTIIALLVGNLMPELFEKDEEAELRQSTPSDKEVVSSPSSPRNNTDKTVVNGVSILKLPGADFEKVEDEDGDVIYIAKLPEKDGFVSFVGIESQRFDFSSMPITLQQMKNFTSRDIKEFMDGHMPNIAEACKKELKEQGLDVDITIIERSGNTGTILIDCKTHYIWQKRILDIRNGQALLVTGSWKSPQDKKVIQACVSSARLAAP